MRGLNKRKVLQKHTQQILAEKCALQQEKQQMSPTHKRHQLPFQLNTSVIWVNK